jgi:Domain of unknown function (DUF4157)
VAVESVTLARATRVEGATRPRERAKPPPPLTHARDTSVRGFLLERQGAIGNRAVASMLSGWSVGPAGDRAEGEAERMADAMLVPSKPPVAASRRTSAAPSPPARIGIGDGHPLDSITARRFGPHVGDHIRHVRVHTGPTAAAAARAVGASAFTAGHDIVFGAGAYAPETAAGQRLIAHELAHVTQNADALTAPRVLRRQPLSPAGDRIHDPLIEDYRRRHEQPAGGIDPQTGARVGPSDAELKYGGGLLSAMSLASCGTLTPGMPQARRATIIACIHHVRFVSLMDQAVASMAQIRTPYAPGLAALYQAVLTQVIAAGTGTTPTPGAALDFTISGSTLAISAGVSLPLASFTLRLEQAPTTGNGSVDIGTGVLTLNETSRSAVLAGVGDTAAAADIERTMYHEGIHFLAGEVSQANRGARAATPQGQVLATALDSETMRLGESTFIAAVTPVWKQIIAAVPRDPSKSAKDAKTLADLHWFMVNPELLAWLEEEIYLRARRGVDFTPADLATFTPENFFERNYWDRIFFDRVALETFLRTNRASIEKQTMPAVRSILKRVLAARPLR